MGKIPWESMTALFGRADIFLFTSLQDSSGAAVFEAMADGLPIVTLDHQGVRAFVPPEAGIRVPVTTPTDTIASLADGLRRLGQSWEVRVKMGDAAWTYARSQTWERRAAQIVSLEAAASGLPLIVTPLYGVEEFIRDGDNGILVEPTPEGIRSGIERFLALPLGVRRAMGEQARLDMERYGTERFVDAWRAFYKNQSLG
jgi:glycosyltransferase involved in cell wall biosynthesis